MRASVCVYHVMLWLMSTHLCTFPFSFPLLAHAPVYSHSAKLCPDGRRLASTGSDRTAKVWDVGMRACLSSLEDHPDMVWSCDWNAAGDALVVGVDDGSTMVYTV